MQTFLKSILILHENREKSKLFKQIYRLKLAFSHTSCIYFTELHLTFHLTTKIKNAQGSKQFSLLPWVLQRYVGYVYHVFHAPLSRIALMLSQLSILGNVSITSL